MRLSCAFATSMDTHEHIRIAESLGYERAWCYDSPALYPDVWVQLCRAAERTSTIGLGPGVLIPSLRHPMATAAAIGTLVELAGPDRVAVAVGTGFTGRLAMGQRPLAILVRHLLPNAVTPALVAGGLLVGDVILTEAALSFLGLGVPEPAPTWGKAIADVRTGPFGSWWAALFPGLAIALTVIAFNLIADGLRDRLDVRGRA